MEKTMYCNNCGEKGHVFKSCSDPVISCGIILLRGLYEPLKLPVEACTISVLMVRRKDSMSFMEFVRGKYDSRDTEYVKRQILNMTVDEQRHIVEDDFEKLWKKLWGENNDKDSVEYITARDKFNSIDRKKIVDSVRSQFNEPEWGFPKGRRMRGETDLECAEREFFEETNIPKDSYVILDNISFSEIFTGTNNITYKHKYFVALLKDSSLFNLRQKLTPVQRREISRIGWKTLTESKNITRPHYTERKKMITELERGVSLAFK
jgi:8-oxo-dGTP pyrophosphatase MutT (NUDIX family)